MKKFGFLSFVCLAVSCSPDYLYPTSTEVPLKTLRAVLADGSDTRTVFGESTTSGSHSQIIWKAGDQLSVFAAAASDQFVTEHGGETAEFISVSGTALTGSIFLGLSPYDETATANVSSKTISATIPAEQSAEAGAFDPAALLLVGSSSKADQMAFYNVCSGLRFTLSGTNVSHYNQIEMSGNDGEILAGPVTISCSNASVPVATAVSGGSTTVTLALPEGKTFKQGEYYYLLFRPGVFNKGFTLTFKNAAGSAVVKSTCASYIEFKRAVFPSLKGADIPAIVNNIRDGELLSKAGTANCYIVSKAGSYKFPLSRATEDAIFSGITDVKVLWETDNTTGPQTIGSIVTNVATNSKYVYFDTPNTLKDGNAVIAAYRDKEIVWSWHIWVCKGYDPKTTSQTYTGKKAAMMDRNLGALAANPSTALSNGLFYQWGRKDPFPGAAESYAASGAQFITTTKDTLPTLISSESVEATVDYAVAHPDVFITTTKTSGDWLASPDNTLWAPVKTEYDPCPAGWKVPAAYVVDSNKNRLYDQEAWSNLADPVSVNYGVYLDAVRAWYPNTGYIGLDGRLLMVGQYCCYWSTSLRTLTAFAMVISSSSGKQVLNPTGGGNGRGYGSSVRCVEDK